MSFKYFFYPCLLVTLILNLTISKSYAVDTPRIKLLSFNKGPWYYNDTSKPLALAQYVKSQNIEIVGLQEGRYESETKSEGILLNNAFKQVGYPMHIIQVKETKHEANIIASKYPFVPNTYSETEFRGRNRIIQRVAVNTPYGILWVTNIHTHNKEPCDGTTKILEHAFVPSGSYSPDQNNIIMGDFNLVLKNATPTLKNECEYASLFTKAQQLLLKTRVSCLDTNFCTNYKGGFIDWIITTKVSPLQLWAVWTDDTIRYIGDGHPPILAWIQSPTFTQTINFDFNNSGKIDIIDVYDFIKYITTSRNLDTKYDYNKDSKINILDVLEIIKVIFS